MRPIEDWTEAELRALPVLRWDASPGIFDAAIVLPVPGELHDSGFRMMDFALVRGGVPFGLRSGGTDALSLVYRTERRGGIYDDLVSIRVDCLPNGLLRLFAPSGDLGLTCGLGLSSMDLTLVDRAG